MPKRLGIQQAAEVAGVHPKTLRRWISRGDLKACTCWHW
jgi:predicted site-specific integrase-resolvase